MQARDADPPVVDAVSLPDGQTFPVGAQVAVDFRCTDRGGSSLRAFSGDVRPGGLLDTSRPGPHTVHLTATDGAGHTTTVTRSLPVAATYRPRWSDHKVRRTLRGQAVTTKVRRERRDLRRLVRARRWRGQRRVPRPLQGRGQGRQAAVRRRTFRTELLQPAAVVHATRRGSRPPTGRRRAHDGRSRFAPHRSPTRAGATS